MKLDKLQKVVKMDKETLNELCKGHYLFNTSLNGFRIYAELITDEGIYLSLELNDQRLKRVNLVKDEYLEYIAEINNNFDYEDNDWGLLACALKSIFDVEVKSLSKYQDEFWLKPAMWWGKR